MIVVDATVLLDFHIGSESRMIAAEKLLEEDPDWISVSLWRYELGNGLRNSVRSKDSPLDSATALGHLENGERLVMETIEELDTEAILETALKHGLTMYDAAYVWAARTRGLKLRTRDDDVLKFCPDVAQPMPLVS